MAFQRTCAYLTVPVHHVDAVGNNLVIVPVKLKTRAAPSPPPNAPLPQCPSHEATGSGGGGLPPRLRRAVQVENAGDFWEDDVLSGANKLSCGDDDGKDKISARDNFELLRMIGAGEKKPKPGRR